MSTPERIAVVGAGLMGHGIAQLFAAAGHQVTIFDSDPDVLAKVPERVRASLDHLRQDTAAVNRIELCGELESAVQPVDMVIEAVIEDVDLKRELMRRIEQATRDHTIMATNTSVIRVGDIAAGTADPSRVIGTHFWNPPTLVPLVEVTQSAATRAEFVSRTLDLLTRIGKEPVHVKRDLPGSVGNRLQHALWREAISLVEAGVVDPAGLDRIVKRSFGMRLPVLGPLENADLVGLDLTLAIHEYLIPDIESRRQPAQMLRDLVASGNLGAKSGHGFRAWTAEELEQTQRRLADHLVSAASVTPQTGS